MKINAVNRVNLQYNRVILKVSGEILGGRDQFTSSYLERIAIHLADALEKGAELLLVIGGGNILRGAEESLLSKLFPPLVCDQIGMLGTVMNGLLLASYLDQYGLKVRHFSKGILQGVTEVYSPSRADQSLKEGEVVIFSGGTGYAGVSTDTVAAFLAVELGAEILLKASKVPGIYLGYEDFKSTGAILNSISYDEMLEKKLQVIDLSAVAVCRTSLIPILVFDFMENFVEKILIRRSIGTLISSFS